MNAVQTLEREAEAQLATTNDIIERCAKNL